MTVAPIRDVRTLVLESTEFSVREVETLREILANDATAVARMREAAAVLLGKSRHASGRDATETKKRLGIVEYLLGRTSLAATHLRGASGDGTAQYFLGRTLMARSDHAGAAEAFEAAAANGFDRVLASLQRAGAMRAAGQREQAERQLKSLESQAAGLAEYHYQMGRLAADAGDQATAAKCYEQALEHDPHHAEALFHAAFLKDLYGDETEAMQLYERCIARSPVHLGAVFNLGTLYEDAGFYDRAARCFQRVLMIYPTQGRARLFLRDCIASRDMYVDDEAERRSDRLAQLLMTPVTDFELSVRSRNCLRKMNVRTLGDLVRTTETELLSEKNFGETSLQEIQELLATKGLKIGMFAEEGVAPPRYAPEPEELSDAEREAMAKPIADLNLSVRARKCMGKLTVGTIGDLIKHTADQLLEVKNFGVTSLNEVRSKLSEIGLKLHGD